MTNFYYADTNGQRQGLINDQQLRDLVVQGFITPSTPLETEGGHKGLAGQIPDLFDGVLPSFALPAPPVVPPPPVNLFCTNCGNTISERAMVCMSCGARPTGHKKFCRHCGVALNPEQIVCIKCGTSLGGNYGAGGTYLSPTVLIKKLNSCFMAYWIFVVIITLASIVLDIMGESAGEDAAGIFALLVVMPVMIIMLVFELILLHQLWRLIPPDIARTTPGKAIGLLFIPFFGLYWQFVAFWGLAIDMNETLQRQGVPYQANAGLGLASCIFLFVEFIPFGYIPNIGILFNAVISIGGAVIGILFLKSVKDGGIALLEQCGQ